MPRRKLFEKFYLLLMLNFITISVLTGYNLLTRNKQIEINVDGKIYSLIIDSKGKSYLFENGNFNRLRNALSARYQVTQEFIKTTGSTYLDFLILQKISKRTCTALEQLTTILTVDTISIPDKTSPENRNFIEKLCLERTIKLSYRNKEFQRIS